MTNKGFTVWLKIDFIHDPTADDYIIKNPKDMMAGSHWQASVGDVTDSTGRVLNKQSVFQIDQTVRNGGLDTIMKNLRGLLPRFLNENGLQWK